MIKEYGMRIDPHKFPLRVSHEESPVDKLLPSEQKILVAIAKTRGKTLYNLEKEKIASKVTIIKALNSLTAKEYLFTERETTGRKRVFYYITDIGLFVAMATEEFWMEPEIVFEVAVNNVEKFPLLFGKLHYFTVNEIVFREIIWRLKYSSGESVRRLKSRISESTKMVQKIMLEKDLSYETSNENEMETMKNVLKVLIKTSDPDTLARDILEYPKDNYLNDQETTFDLALDSRDATLKAILGLKDILSIRRNIIPLYLGILLVASKDEELREYIDNFFREKREELKLSLERINWWEKILNVANKTINKNGS